MYNYISKILKYEYILEGRKVDEEKNYIMFDDYNYDNTFYM